MTSDNPALDVVHMGKGRDLVLLHSLLSDRSAFDRIASVACASVGVVASRQNVN